MLKFLVKKITMPIWLFTTLAIILISIANSVINNNTTTANTSGLTNANTINQTQKSQKTTLPAPKPTATHRPAPVATATHIPVQTTIHQPAAPIPTATNPPAPIPTATNPPAPTPTATNPPVPIPTATNPPAPTPTATNPPVWTVIQTFTGNGDENTNLFNAPNTWRIVWSCDPSSSFDGSYNLMVDVNNSDTSSLDPGAINTICQSGNTSGMTNEYQGGTVYLDVTSEAAWTIQIEVLQ